MSAPTAISQTLRITPDGLRSRLLCATEQYRTVLGYYPAGIFQPDHKHDRAQLSFLLSGGYAEIERGRDYQTTTPLHKFRPEGSRHSVGFGRYGALILSIDFTDSTCVRSAPDGWRANGRWVVDLCRLIFTGAMPAQDVVDDLIAGLNAENAPARQAMGMVPHWVRCAAEQFADDPHSEVGSVAKNAGVHRVHLSRAFRKYMGASPSQYRLFCKSARAYHRMIDHGETPAIAAAAGGFADQAHWTRASRALAGVGPGRLRALLTV